MLQIRVVQNGQNITNLFESRDSAHRHDGFVCIPRELVPDFLLKFSSLGRLFLFYFHIFFQVSESRAAFNLSSSQAVADPEFFYSLGQPNN